MKWAGDKPPSSPAMSRSATLGHVLGWEWGALQAGGAWPCPAGARRERFAPKGPRAGPVGRTWGLAAARTLINQTPGARPAAAPQGRGSWLEWPGGAPPRSLQEALWTGVLTGEFGEVPIPYGSDFLTQEKKRFLEEKWQSSQRFWCLGKHKFNQLRSDTVSF